MVSESELAPGGVSWVEVSVPLTRPLPGAAWALVLGAEAGPARLLPFAEVVRTARRAATVRVPVHLAPEASTGRARGTLVVVPAGEERAVGRAPVTRVVRARGGGTALDTAALVAAHAGWTEVALAHRAAFPSLAQARLDVNQRMSVPELDAVEAARGLGRARVERFAAEAALRARFLDDPTLETQREALAGLAQLETETLPPPRDTVARTLSRIEADLRRGRLSRARGRVDSLRRAGTANRSELARLLLFEGLLAAARGLRSGTDIAIGQALCLQPNLSVDLGQPLLTAPLAPRKRNSPCRDGTISVGPLAAERRMQDGAAALAVLGRVDDDPFQLVTEARVERFGPGGGHIFTVTAPVDERRRFEARFTGERERLHAPNQVGIRVSLLDRTGVVVARGGAPDPLLVPLEDGEGVGGFSVPGWVWWTAGALVLVGAATAGAVVASDQQEVRRGLGPFTVDF